MKDPLFDVTDKVIVVTGGMGQLGRRFVIALADRGARLVILDLAADQDTAHQHYGERADDPKMFFAAANVVDRLALSGHLKSVVDKWGGIDGLINCAALDSPPNAPVEENGPFETYPEASWDSVMEVNVKGTLLPCQVFGAAMAAGHGGSIVNICSTYGMVSPDQGLYDYRRSGGEDFYKPVAYSASKSALLNLTRYMATYWAKDGVRVNTLTFGGVYNGQDETFLAGYNTRVPIGRMAQPTEYDGAVVFLMSSASSYMTGSNLVIDGGWTAW